jgi:hypothetical protein
MRLTIKESTEKSDYPGKLLFQLSNPTTLSQTQTGATVPGDLEDMRRAASNFLHFFSSEVLGPDATFSPPPDIQITERRGGSTSIS